MGAWEWPGLGYDYFRPFWEANTFPPGNRATWNLLLSLKKNTSPNAVKLYNALETAGYYDALKARNELELWFSNKLYIGHIPGAELVPKFPLYATTNINISDSTDVLGVNIDTSGQIYAPVDKHPLPYLIKYRPILVALTIFLLILAAFLVLARTQGPWRKITSV